jgi:Protein of unknown function (DUF4058)
MMQLFRIHPKWTAMPLHDHFRPPISDFLPWESLHANWAMRIADRLNRRWLPEFFQALEHIHVGTNLEIDVATFERPMRSPLGAANGPATATAEPQLWSPPEPAATVPAVFLESFEVLVFNTEGGRKLVGAVEIISPRNKDREEARRAFAIKCASYLHQGISLVIMDTVTTRRAALHDDIMALLDRGGTAVPRPAAELYSLAYRPVLRKDEAGIDLWFAPVAVGSPLPTMPLRVFGDLFVPIEFEAAYVEACESRRLV